MPSFGYLAATEAGADDFTASGTADSTGSLDATETGSDTFSAQDGGLIGASMAAQETGADAFTASGSAPSSGSMAATEAGSDTFSTPGFKMRPPGGGAAKKARQRIKTVWQRLEDARKKKNKYQELEARKARAELESIASKLGIAAPAAPEIETLDSVLADLVALSEQAALGAGLQQLKAVKVPEPLRF